MRTFIENYLHFMKNCTRLPYEKLKPLKSGFIENSNFENNRDPCVSVRVKKYWCFFVVVVIVFVHKTIFCKKKFLFVGKGGEQYYLNLFASQFFGALPHTYPVFGVGQHNFGGQGVHP